jgi:hypothetical protein
MPWESANDVWDASVEERSWRGIVEKARKAQDMLEQEIVEKISSFYVLCLSELDAAVEFTRPESFLTRTAFVAELKRLIAHPTAPSRPVPNVKDYQRAQKLWLECMINKYDAAR